jgi:hypothetical protein
MCIRVILYGSSGANVGNAVGWGIPGYIAPVFRS